MNQLKIRRLSSLFALVVVPVAAVALTACEPECVDRYDCRSKNTSDTTYTCVDNKCVKDTSGFGQGGGAGGGEGGGAGGGVGGGAGGGGGTEDAGMDAGTDGGETDGGLTDGGETDGGLTDGGEDAGIIDAGFSDDAGYWKLFAQLNDQQTVPPGQAYAGGDGVFHIHAFTDGGYTLVWSVDWFTDGGTLNPFVPTTASVINAPGGMNGTVVFATALTTASPTSSTTAITADQATEITKGRTYVELTQAVPSSPSIRGQILFAGERFYAATLTGAQEVPPTDSTNTGGFHVILPSDGGVARYSGNWTGLDGGFAASHIHFGDAGEAGNAWFTLVPFADAGGVDGTIDQTPDGGEFTLQNLEGGHLYMNVHSGAYPNGEIRGQLYRKN